MKRKFLYLMVAILVIQNNLIFNSVVQTSTTGNSLRKSQKETEMMARKILTAPSKRNQVSTGKY